MKGKTLARVNKEWHLKNRMPKNAGSEQQLEWHVEHQKHCGCRPMPEGLKKLVSNKSRRKVGRKQQRPGVSRKTVLATLRRNKQRLVDDYKIKELGVFGSVVRGDQKRISDVDILVDFREVPDLLEFVKLADELEDALHNKVDLVHKPAIRPELRDRILAEAVYV